MKKCAYCGSEFDGALHECPYCGGRAADHICKNCGAEYDGAVCPQCGVRADDEGQRCPRCGARMFKGECSSCGYIADRSRAAVAEVKKVGSTVASMAGTFFLCLVGFVLPFVSNLAFFYGKKRGSLVKWLSFGYSLFYIAAMLNAEQSPEKDASLGPILAGLTALSLVAVVFRVWKQRRSEKND